VILLKFSELARRFYKRSYSVTLLTMNFIPFTLLNVVIERQLLLVKNYGDPNYMLMENFMLKILCVIAITFQRKICELG